ncbi:hypothetical protein [Pantoea agglomerans]|uniref:hypothetical protein n=1 Tax=Enterobacter agglomerans TaxID=549 RepID=UPI0037098E05
MTYFSRAFRAKFSYPPNRVPRSGWQGLAEIVISQVSIKEINLMPVAITGFIEIQ